MLAAGSGSAARPITLERLKARPIARTRIECAGRGR